MFNIFKQKKTIELQAMMIDHLTRLVISQAKQQNETTKLLRAMNDKMVEVNNENDELMNTLSRLQTAKNIKRDNIIRLVVDNN